MKRMISFGKRTLAEILRDPLTAAFGLGFPLVLLFLMSAIQSNIPVELFAIDRLAPGITVFGLAFMTLFSASLIAKDRESAFLQRLYTTPMTARDFILGYMLPFIPIALMQEILCYLAAIPLGLRANAYVPLAVIANLPAAVLFTAMGLLFGSILTEKQVGGICGALITNLTAWLSGVWFDLSLTGSVIQKIADILPFSHAVSLERAIIAGDLTGTVKDLVWVSAYAAAAFAAAIYLFMKQMRRQ